MKKNIIDLNQENIEEGFSDFLNSDFSSDEFGYDEDFDEDEFIQAFFPDNYQLNPTDTSKYLDRTKYLEVGIQNLQHSYKNMLAYSKIPKEEYDGQKDYDKIISETENIK